MGRGLTIEAPSQLNYFHYSAIKEASLTSSDEEEDSDGTLISTATVSKWETHFRCVIADEMMREGGQRGSEFRKIGGLGLTGI